LADEPNISEANLLRLWWTWICASPENLAIMRLGLEAAALDATLTGVSSTVREQQIGVWRTLIERRLRSEGLTADEARIEASMLKATFTGLSIGLTAALEETLVRLETRYSQPDRSKGLRSPKK
jgi:hypothetical protein